MTGCRAEFIRPRWWKKQPVRTNSHLRHDGLQGRIHSASLVEEEARANEFAPTVSAKIGPQPHLVPSSAASLIPAPPPYSLTPAALHRERGDLCGFAEPSARGEV